MEYFTGIKTRFKTNRVFKILFIYMEFASCNGHSQNFAFSFDNP